MIKTSLKRRIAMGNVRTLGCALAFFSSLVLVASAASAQPCTPVVIAFRHAEDTKDTGVLFTLTPTGMKHADLYAKDAAGPDMPGMVSDFTKANGFCDVTKVYSTTTADKPDFSKNATNAFFTGKPLANSVMKGEDPIISVNGVNEKGKAQVYQLDEYLGNGISFPTNPVYNKPVAIALVKELLKTANSGQSSAIFWTSQGLHVLGGVIIGKNSAVPDKNKVDKEHAGTPPRNAAYVFRAIGTAPDIKAFNDIPLRGGGDPVQKASFYVQCFNHTEYDQGSNVKSPQFTQAYYCGFNSQGDLGGKPTEPCDFRASDAKCGSSIPNDKDPANPPQTNKDVKGKICDTTKLLQDQTADTYGVCGG